MIHLVVVQEVIGEDEIVGAWSEKDVAEAVASRVREFLPDNSYSEVVVMTLFIDEWDIKLGNFLIGRGGIDESGRSVV